jgi:D-sedoheptulose 7-phosphate isomerase
MCYISLSSGDLTMKDAIRRAFDESVRAKQAFLRDSIDVVVQAVEAIVTAFGNGNKLLIFGNGGSAADAQHIAAEFVNRYRIERPPLPAIALTTDSSALTSIANDYDYTEIFAKQIRALGKPGDVALAISTSGNAGNVLRALQACRELKITTIGFTGGNGGKLVDQVDHLLCVSRTTDTARIQETHILIGHVICELIDAQLFPGN